MTREPQSDAGQALAEVPGSVAGRVVRTLELLASGPLTAADLGRALDINRSTALRLLAELIEAGCVQRDPDTKRYSTVPSWFLGIAAPTSGEANWPEMIDPLLLRMRDESEESVILAAPVDTGMVYLTYHSTPHVLALSERAGTVRPLHCSAIGIAYLSALPTVDRQQLLTRLDYSGGTARAAKTPADLTARVRQAQRDGYSTDLEESFELVRCVAVPLQIKGVLAGAVGISGPSSRLPVSRLRELGAYLRREVGGFVGRWF